MESPGRPADSPQLALTSKGVLRSRRLQGGCGAAGRACKRRGWHPARLTRRFNVRPSGRKLARRHSTAFVQRLFITTAPSSRASAESAICRQGIHTYIHTYIHVWLGVSPLVRSTYMYSNHPALRERIIKRSGLSKVPKGPKRMAGLQRTRLTDRISGVPLRAHHGWARSGEKLKVLKV